MALTLKISDISYEIFLDINQDSNFSEASISFWVRNAIGSLNNKINTSIEIDETTLEFNPSLTENQKVILKQMFEIYYYGFLIRLNLGAAQISVIDVKDALGGSVKLTDRNLIAKTYKDLQKDAENTLKDMIAQYKINVIEPLDVQGRDNIGNSSSIIDPLKVRRRYWR